MRNLDKRLKIEAKNELKLVKKNYPAIHEHIMRELGSKSYISDINFGVICYLRNYIIKSEDFKLLDIYHLFKRN